MRNKKFAALALSFIQFVSPITIFALAFFSNPPQAFAYANPSTVNLLTVSNFAALAASSVTSPTGPTVLNNGDLGIASPGTCTDFPSPCSPPNVNGTLSGGSIQFQNAAATTGQTDATSLVTDLNGRAADATLLAQLGGQTLTQGIYDVPAAATNLTGDLTLSGDANSIFILRLSSTLITDTGSRVLLTGGAQACNVFWTVGSSATFNGTTTMVGTVLASASITFSGGGATLDGRAVAQSAAITFNNTTVNNSSCATVTPTPTATTTTTTSSTTTVSSTTDAPVYACPTIPVGVTAPNIIDSRRIDADSIFLSWGPYSGTDRFNVRYGPTDGNWLYNVDVTGFSTTLNDLPANQAIWVQVAARNECQIADYGNAVRMGGFVSVGLPNTGVPGLPNTGYAPNNNQVPWYILVGMIFGSSVLLISIQRKH